MTFKEFANQCQARSCITLLTNKEYILVNYTCYHVKNGIKATKTPIGITVIGDPIMVTGYYTENKLCFKSSSDLVVELTNSGVKIPGTAYGM